MNSLLLLLLLLLKTIQTLDNNNCAKVRALYASNSGWNSSKSETKDSVCLPDICCTGFGHLFETKAKQEIKSSLKSIFLPLIQSIDEKGRHIRHHLLSNIRTSLSRTDSLTTDAQLRDISGRLHQHLAQLLFNNSSAHNESHERWEERKSEKLIDRLFTQLFVSEFETRKRKHFCGQYLECVQNVWKEYQSFGRAPTLLYYRLERAQQYSNLLLKSISLLGQIFAQSLALFEPKNQCLKELIRLLFCRKCSLSLTTTSGHSPDSDSGQSSDTLCPLHCQRVHELCFSALNEFWFKKFSNFVQIFGHFSNSLIKDKNPETLYLRSVSLLWKQSQQLLDKHINQTVKKVRLSCGHPNRYLRSSFEPKQPLMSTHEHNRGQELENATQQSDDRESLFLKIQTFSHFLFKNRDIFSFRFPQKLCQTNGDKYCWTGTEVRETQSMTGNDSIEQHFEPKETETTFDKTVFHSLVQKLEKLEKLMDSSVAQNTYSSEDVYQMDVSDQYSGSGDDQHNGHFTDLSSDDEDYAMGSGSGGHSDHYDNSDDTTLIDHNNDIAFDNSHVNNNEMNNSSENKVISLFVTSFALFLNSFLKL